jgi:hypothetical protein
MRGDSLKAWPSLPSIEAATGRSRRQVLRDRAELVEAGLLLVQSGGGRGRSTSYIGHLKGGTHATLSESQRVAPDAPKGGTHATRTPPTGCEHADDAAEAGAASSSADLASRSNGEHPDGPPEAEAPDVERNLRGVELARGALRRRPA